MLRAVGLNASRDVVANWEVQRSIITDLQLLALSIVFGVQPDQLFPSKRKLNRVWRA